MSVSLARINIGAETAYLAGGAELLREAQGRLCDAGWVIGLGGPRPSNQCPGEVTPRRSRPLEGQSNTLASFDYRATMPRLASGKRFNGFRFFLESRPDHNPPFVSSTFIAAL